MPYDDPQSYLTALHTLPAFHNAPQRVSNNNSTYVCYTTDYSNDATADVVLDSQYKKKEALSALLAHFVKGASA